MPIGGIVISLVSEPAQAQVALDHLARQQDLELGPVSEAAGILQIAGANELRRIPAVLETDSAKHMQARIRELQNHTGIFLVDVAYIGMTEIDEIPGNPIDRASEDVASK